MVNEEIITVCCENHKVNVCTVCVKVSCLMIMSTKGLKVMVVTKRMIRRKIALKITTKR